MKCPHCQFEEEDAAAECRRCGFVLAKWKAARQRAENGPAAPSVFIQRPAQQSGWGLTLWVALLAAAAGVWILERKDTNADSSPASSGPTSLSWQQPGAEQASSPDGWRFQGRVTDLLRGNPIKDAKVSFTDFQTGHAYETATDEDGRYAVDVEVRWKLGYGANIFHPSFQRRYWTGADILSSRQQRLRLGSEPPSGEPDTRSYRGSKKAETVRVDFALFPQDLSDAERQEAGR